MCQSFQLLRQGLKARFDTLTNHYGPFAQSFLLNNIKDSVGGCYRERIASVGATKSAWMGCIHDIRTARDGRKRETACQIYRAVMEETSNA